MDEASQSSLQSEFNTTNEDEVIKKILTAGSPQVGKVSHFEYSIHNEV